MPAKRKIGDIVSLDEALPPLYKPAELYGHVLELVDAEEKTGNFGNTFYHLTVRVPDSGQELVVMTGALQIVNVVNAWIELGKEPCMFVFQKVRNMEWMVDPEEAAKKS